MASICCSPPDSVPAGLVEALREPREQLAHAVDVAIGIRRRPPDAAQDEVLAHASCRPKTRRPSGQCEMPSATMRSVEARVMSDAVVA